MSSSRQPLSLANEREYRNCNSPCCWVYLRARFKVGSKVASSRVARLQSWWCVAALLPNYHYFTPLRLRAHPFIF